MEMLIAGVFGFLVLFIAVQHFKLKSCRDAVSKFRGPFCLPWIGALHLMFLLDTKTVLDLILKVSGRYGRIMKGWAFNRLVVASTDIELNEQLLSNLTHITKQRNYLLLSPWLGTGLLEFVEVFDQQSDILVERLAKEADGKRTFDAYPYICLAALDIIAETAMGTKVYAQSDESSEYALGVNEITKLMAWRFMKILMHSELLFTILKPRMKLRQTHLIKVLHEFTINVIRNRRQALAESMKESLSRTTDDNSKPKKRMALLDVLLQSTVDGKPLTNDAIREEVDTFMFEGHDTSTSAICFSLHHISRHPEIQKRLHAEVTQIIGKSKGSPITIKDLNELKYLECIIKETLRMTPVIPVIGRQIMEDFKYTHSKYGDGIIPAGTEFLILIYGIMCDPEYFQDPLKFIPERHLNTEGREAFKHIPFSAGPRNCIGQKYAMLEIKLLLAKIVRDYELLPFGENVQLDLNIVLRSGNGFQLGMRKRP